MTIYVFEELDDSGKVIWREHFSTLAAAQEWAADFSPARYMISGLEANDDGRFEFERVWKRIF